MITVKSVFEYAVRSYPTSTAIIVGEKRLTYRELGDGVRRTITVLQSLGVREGDRVAILAQNSVQFIEIWLAVPMMGAALAPLNTRLTGHELQPIIAEYEPHLILTDWDLDTVSSLAPSGTNLHPMGASFGALVDLAEPGSPSCKVGEDDVMSVVYTGGTTGRSKGVMLTHRNRVSDAMAMITATRMTSRDVWFNCSPVFHTSGTFCILPLMWTGGAMVIESKFDAAVFADRVKSYGVTMCQMVPKMIQDVLDNVIVDDVRLKSLRFLGHGGAPITEPLLREACERLPNVEFSSVYGSTELSPVATVFQHQEQHLGGGRFASCGQPVIGVEVRILGDEGKILDERVIGEVAVRGPNVMKGYFRRPDATSEVIIDGFYRTGDLGFIDEEGYVYVVDRKKDMIISGGENIYSLEIETVIAEFPGVIEVAVYGRPHDGWGETVAATIVANAEFDLEQLKIHCRERLAGYKQPRHIDVVQTPLPRTPAGKVSKRDLRRMAINVGS